MRPAVGGDALPPVRPTSRKSSVAEHSAAHTSTAHTVPTTFFLRSEEEIDQSLTDSTSSSSTSKQRDSTYGVQSLADTLETAFGDGNDTQEDPLKKGISGLKQKDGEEISRPTSKNSDKVQDIQSNCLSSRDTSPRKRHVRQTSQQAFATPVTPLNIESSVPDSVIPSTPKSVSMKSFRLSDEESGLDEAASQAIASSGEEEEEDTQTGGSSSFPQLVMPSIQMPSRRPFTTKGKNMGRLKVLIAGEAGAGKTSLIRSIVQLCEDIVHVDPLSPTHSVLHSSPPKSKSRRKKPEIRGTTKITEVHASTRAYPSWWADMEESRVLRRRKSMGDTVLERNLCFIDTPGYSRGPSCAEDMDPVIEYIESLLSRNASIGTISDNDLLSVLSGNGGVQVDVVFYLLPPNNDISKDVEYMQRLSSLTNVIPVISKADTLTPAQIVSIKTSVLARLQSSSIKPFLFGKALDDALLAVQGLSISTPNSSSDTNVDQSPESSINQGYFRAPTPPYAVSSTPGSDSETMDASLLMSPDYVQPLVPSELAALIAQVFDSDAIAWLRHSAAKKFLAWRNKTKFSVDSAIMHGHTQQRCLNSRGSSLGLNTTAFSTKGGLQDPFSRLTTAPTSSTSSILSSPSPSGVLVPHPHSPFCLSHSNSNSNFQSPFPGSSPSLSHTALEGLEGPSDFTLACLRDHTQREERLAQVRLAKWATDLQRSLRNEKERFEEVQRGERAKWLLERVGEEVRGGNIVTSSSPPSGRADWAVVRHGNGKNATNSGQRYVRAGRVDSRDPLGLCDFSDEVRRRGFVVFKVLGGMGMLGAVMVAVVRACGFETGLQEGGNWGWFIGSGE